MSRKIKLTPGLYWFYGFCRDNKGEDERFYKMFEDLSLNNGSKWSYGTGKGEGHGIFYFHVNPDDSYSLVEWVSPLNTVQVRSIVGTGIQLDFECPGYVLANNQTSHSGLVQFKAGITECDETCIFYYCCDGERDSSFNPSNYFLKCSEYKLNKEDIEWPREKG